MNRNSKKSPYFRTDDEDDDHHGANPANRPKSDWRSSRNRRTNIRNEAGAAQPFHDDSTSFTTGGDSLGQQGQPTQSGRPENNKRHHSRSKRPPPTKINPLDQALEKQRGSSRNSAAFTSTSVCTQPAGGHKSHAQHRNHQQPRRPKTSHVEDLITHDEPRKSKFKHSRPKLKAAGPASAHLNDDEEEEGERTTTHGNTAAFDKLPPPMNGVATMKSQQERIPKKPRPLNAQESIKNVDVPSEHDENQPRQQRQQHQDSRGTQNARSGCKKRRRRTMDSSSKPPPRSQKQKTTVSNQSVSLESSDDDEEQQRNNSPSAFVDLCDGSDDETVATVVSQLPKERKSSSSSSSQRNRSGESTSEDGIRNQQPKTGATRKRARSHDATTTDATITQSKAHAKKTHSDKDEAKYRDLDDCFDGSNKNSPEEDKARQVMDVVARYDEEAAPLPSLPSRSPDDDDRVDQPTQPQMTSSSLWSGGLGIVKRFKDTASAAFRLTKQNGFKSKNDGSSGKRKSSTSIQPGAALFSSVDSTIKNFSPEQQSNHRTVSRSTRSQTRKDDEDADYKSFCLSPARNQSKTDTVDLVDTPPVALAQPVKRRSARLNSTSQKKKSSTNEVIDLESQSVEDAASTTTTSTAGQKRMGSMRGKIKPIRIAIGKKNIFHADCKVHFVKKEGHLVLEYKTGDSAETNIEARLSAAQLVELKYFSWEDDQKIDSNEEDDLEGMNFLAVRFDKAECQKHLNIPNSSSDADRLILIEFRNQEDLRELLAKLQSNDDIKLFATAQSKLSKADARVVAEPLISALKAEASHRLMSSPVGKKDDFIKNRDEDDILLVFPFGAPKPQLDKAAEGLTEASNVPRSRSIAGTEEGVVDVEEKTEGSEAKTGEKKGRGRAHYLTLRVVDYERLEPGEFLNDTLVDFWMQWLARDADKSQVHFFSSHFFSTLEDEGAAGVRKWTERKKINIFEKKFIFIPVNKMLHWSLCVVVNPSAIDAAPDDQQEFPCILFLDSLKAHRKMRVAKKVREWLNAEWARVNNKPSEDVYNKETMKLFTPIIPYQDNGCDCGVFVCRYAWAVYNLVSEVFSREQSENEFMGLITKNGFFQFGMGDISRFRNELKTLMRNLSAVYIPWQKEEDRKEREEEKREKKQALAHRELSTTSETEKKQTPPSQEKAEKEREEDDEEEKEKDKFANRELSTASETEKKQTPPSHENAEKEEDRKEREEDEKEKEKNQVFANQELSAASETEKKQTLPSHETVEKENGQVGHSDNLSNLPTIHFKDKHEVEACFPTNKSAAQTVISRNGSGKVDDQKTNSSMIEQDEGWPAECGSMCQDVEKEPPEQDGVATMTENLANLPCISEGAGPEYMDVSGEGESESRACRTPEEAASEKRAFRSTPFRREFMQSADRDVAGSPGGLFPSHRNESSLSREASVASIEEHEDSSQRRCPGSDAKSAIDLMDAEDTDCTHNEPLGVNSSDPISPHMGGLFEATAQV